MEMFATEGKIEVEGARAATTASAWWSTLIIKDSAMGRDHFPRLELRSSACERERRLVGLAGHLVKPRESTSIVAPDWPSSLADDERCARSSSRRS